VARALFLQWLDGALASGPVDLFADEYRSPIYVNDLCALCNALVMGDMQLEACTFNAGGPERLSRADMGDAVAAVRGYPRAHVKRVPSASVVRTPASPADISMSVALLESVFPGRLTPFSEALRAIWAMSGGADA
jgi:dTDP-4-dehydrorhamnose reductase